MTDEWRTALWRQLGGAIDMLENAVAACPDGLWGGRQRSPQFWHLVYHTLFFLDLYLSGTLEGFAPPPPFGLTELDPAGVLPDRVYTREEMLRYLRHCRDKCRRAVEGMTAEDVARTHTFPWLEIGGGELMLTNLRHVQHHTAQLNLLLRQETDSAPRWVFSARDG
jgi:hypothetical protein